MNNFIKINPMDTVAVALETIPKGTTLDIDNEALLLLEEIPNGHKFSLCHIPKNTKIIKYGNPIGIAAEDIPAGAHIHTHNLKTGLNELLDYTYEPSIQDAVSIKGSDSTRTFMGYKRADRNAGIRNEIWIIPTVGCVNNVAKAIEQASIEFKCGTIDDIIAFSHPYGCSQMGEDQENTRKLLADLATHPNAGGVLLLGLGCENSGIEEIKKYLGSYNPDSIRFLVAQDCQDEIEEGVRLVKELIAYAGQFEREPIPCSQLVVGLKCGGSDGFSGITANPIVGSFSDMLIAEGGTTILTEVPEMFGAETLLMNRCINEDIFNKTVKLINDFKLYYKKNNQTIYENPSPGNKKGGISTLEDKALGCTQKSGSSPVVDVLSYGDKVVTSGLNLLSAPGNDLVAATALAASGAQLVLFTTGRGTPFACPVPTVKISTNTGLMERKRNWIDFNCGTLVEGDSFSDIATDLYDYVFRVSDGEKVISEKMGYHDMAIFKQGVTL